MPAKVYRPRALVQLGLVFQPNAVGTAAQVARDAVQTVNLPTATGIRALALEGATAIDLAPTVEALPSRLTIRRNNIRTADTMSATIDYLRLPIDPRALQNIRVAVYLWDSPDGSPPPPTVENLAFLGLVDEPRAVLGSGDDSVRLTARDYTSVLLDRRVPDEIVTNSKGRQKRRGKTYRVDRPFKDVVVELFNDAGEGAAQLRDVFIASTNSNEQALQRRLSDVTGNRRFHTKPNDNLWDVLSRMCDRLALLPYFVFDELQINPVYDVPATEYRFEYGQNIRTLTYKKSFNGTVGRPIEFRAYNPVTNETTVGRYPVDSVPKYIPPTNSSAQGNQEPKQLNDSAAVLLLQGSFTEQQLNLRAEEYYARARREDLQGDFRTKDLDDLDGRNLLQMKNGDAVDIRIERSDWRSIWNADSPQQAIAELVQTGLDPETARRLIEGTRSYNSQTSRLYIKEARHTFSSDNGYELRVEFTSTYGTDL